MPRTSSTASAKNVACVCLIMVFTKNSPLGSLPTPVQREQFFRSCSARHEMKSAYHRRLLLSSSLEGGIRLSRGQAPRTAAAGMFVRDPELLVFDHLMKALDQTMITVLSFFC